MARNSAFYLSIPAVQQFDPTACWAASLEWWARAVGGGRPIITQTNLINLYVRYWDSSDPDTNPDYGTVSRANLITILRDPRWRMDCETVAGSNFTTSYLNTKMRWGPCVVGYFEPDVGGNHVVVAYGASQTHMAVMNPDGARFQGRNASHFQSSSEVIVGVPRL